MSSHTKCIHQIKKTGIGKEKDKKLSIILLNSLCAYRMRSFGPRCLLKLNNGEMLIDSQLKLLREYYPNSEIIMTIGFDAEKIIKKKIAGVRYVENQLFENTNIAEEIRLGINNCETSNILLIQGETVLTHDAVSNITKNGSCILCVDQVSNDEDDVGATVINDYLSILAHGLQPKFGGIAFITDPELNFFKNHICVKENNNLYLFELINLLAQKYQKIKVIHPSESTLLRIESIKDIQCQDKTIQN